MPSSPPTVSWSPATETGVEGSAIALGTVVASGSAPLTSVIVGGLLAGAVLSDGTHSFTASTSTGSVNILGWNDAKLSVTPPTDTNETLTVTATDTTGATSSAATETVVVNPLAPTVTPVAVSGTVGQPVALNLGLKVNGLFNNINNDANSLASVTIGGIPAGVVLSNNGGTLTPSGGAVTFSAAQITAGALNGLAATPTAAGSFTLSVSATERDAEGNVSAAASGSETVTASGSGGGTGGSGRTISTSISGPVTLASTDTPLTITGTGTITSTAAGADGIDGASGTTWSITSSGLVTSASGSGISLAGGGTIANSGRISGSRDGAAFTSATGTVTNSGSIAGTTEAGVLLNLGGSVTNAAGGQISAAGSGSSAIFTTGAAGYVTNSGSIAGTGYEGVLLNAGGTVTNQATGRISGVDSAVFLKNLPGQVFNYGSITGTGTNGTAVYLQNNGGVTNAQGASAWGAKFGVFLEGGAGTVANSGTIIGASYDGAVVGLGGTVTNTASGTITGGSNGIYGKYRGPATVTNAGTISGTGTSGAGVDLAGGGSLVNNAQAAISGNAHGVFVGNATGTITNSGSIVGSKYHGVTLNGGGSVTNASGASIVGGTGGVAAGAAAAAAVTNTGTILANAASGAGTDLEGGGSVTNNAGGTISGQAFGAFFTGRSGALTNNGNITGQHGAALQLGGSVINNALIQGQVAGISSGGGPVTVTNAGSILATAGGGAAADIEGGGTVTNNAGATLSGSGYGVYIAGGTVANAGTISGSSYAVKFAGSGTNRLVVQPGAVFNGAVGGASSGSNTLELAGGSGTLSYLSGGSGTVTQNGQSWSFYVNWGSIAVDAGASWTFNTTDTVGTVLANGTASVTGALDLSAGMDPASTGLFVLNGGSSLDVAKALATQAHIQFLGSSALLVDDFTAFGTNVGSSAYAGPQLQDFGAGDTIDLKNFSAAGATVQYDGSTGLLQLSNGASQHASLGFQTASAGSGSFHLASDGGAGTTVTLS